MERLSPIASHAAEPLAEPLRQHARFGLQPATQYCPQSHPSRQTGNAGRKPLPRLGSPRMERLSPIASYAAEPLAEPLREHTCFGLQPATLKMRQSGCFMWGVMEYFASYYNARCGDNACGKLICCGGRRIISAGKHPARRLTMTFAKATKCFYECC